MGKRKEAPEKLSIPQFAPAQNRDERLSQLEILAYARMEERIRNGTASGQELIWCAQQGSSVRRLDERLKEAQTVKTETQTEAIRAGIKNEQLLADGLAAFKTYVSTGGTY